MTIEESIKRLEEMADSGSPSPTEGEGREAINKALHLLRRYVAMEAKMPPESTHSYINTKGQEELSEIATAINETRRAFLLAFLKLVPTVEEMHNQIVVETLKNSPRFPDCTVAEFHCAVIHALITERLKQ